MSVAPSEWPSLFSGVCIGNDHLRNFFRRMAIGAQHQVVVGPDAPVAVGKEIIVAFDRQFQELGDKEFKHLTKNLTKLNDKYKNEVNISFIFDKNMITGYKDSPIDCGPDIFLKLFKERIIL